MELKVKPHHTSASPLKGILIKGESVDFWVKEIQRMNISLEDVGCFVIPGLTANSVWACLIVSKRMDVSLIGQNSLYQLVYNRLFIPENSVVYPLVSKAEIEKLFPKASFFHPETGYVELEEAIQWESLIEFPKEIEAVISKPSKGVYLPSQIHSMQVMEASPEEVLKAMEKEFLPEKKKMEEKPLTAAEKVKLSLLRALFGKDKPEKEVGKKGMVEGKAVQSADEVNWWGNIKNWFANSKASSLMDDLQTDKEELERRNKKELDRLLDLFKDNPDEALKYAIPLDSEGTSRGGNNGAFSMDTKRWFNFSLFGQVFRNTSGGGPSVVMPEDAFVKLNQQYNATANQLLQNKEYEKAAFIYIKLLKNHHRGAQVLEEGECYQEAASVYLKYGENKVKAAECYEKGKMYTQAIELHKELNNKEKVGDLYLVINKRKEAENYYLQVVDDYKATYEFVKASLIQRYKMNNAEDAQSLLLEGWRSNKDSFNCLNNYFINIDNIEVLDKELYRVYRKETHSKNKEVFLRVIQQEYTKHPELSENIRDISYEIIAEKIDENPEIASEVKFFNKEDKNILKDIMKYKQRRRLN